VAPSKLYARLCHAFLVNVFKFFWGGNVFSSMVEVACKYHRCKLHSKSGAHGDRGARAYGDLGGQSSQRGLGAEPLVLLWWDVLVGGRPEAQARAS